MQETAHYGVKSLQVVTVGVPATFLQQFEEEVKAIDNSCARKGTVMYWAQLPFPVTDQRALMMDKNWRAANCLAAKVGWSRHNDKERTLITIFLTRKSQCEAKLGGRRPEAHFEAAFVKRLYLGEA